MSRVLMLLVVLSIGLIPAGLLAQGDEAGAISAAQLSALRASFRIDPDTRAIMNAVANNKLREVALDQETLKTSNMFFSNKIEIKGITNQNSTGRCWMYAGLNLLRPKVVEKYNLSDFEFSEAYLFFWDKMEKANLFLEAMIERRDRDLSDREIDWLWQNPMPDGGQWNMFVELVKKYGVVPSTVMPENEQSKDSKVWNGLLFRKLRKDAIELREMNRQGKKLKDLRSRKTEMLQDVYRVLAITLGDPPTRFVWRYEDKDGKVSEPRTFTPAEFFSEVVEDNLDDYVYLLNNPIQKYGGLFEIQFDRDMWNKPNMTVVNVSPGDLKDVTLKSVLGGDPVWFGCDVGQEHHRDKGVGVMASGIYRYDSVYGMDFSMPKAERILSRDGVPSHAMIFAGVDVADGKPGKWLVENSWGTDYGDEGMWMMSDAWFDDYVYGVVIHKKYATPAMLDALRQKPVVLPPWDPMYSAAMWQ